MTGFSLRRDFKYVQWGRTFQVMFIRAVGAAIIAVIIAGALIAYSPKSLGSTHMSFSDMLLAALYGFGAITFGATFIYPWMGLICWYLLSFFGKVEGKTRRFMTTDNAVFFLPMIFMGLFALLGYVGITILLMLGDPLTFTLHRMKPGWVPVEKYGFLNIVPIVFVVDPQHMASLRMAGTAN